MPKYTHVVKDTHWLIPKDELPVPIDTLKRLFTIRPRFADGVPVELWQETPSFFGVPRYYKDIGREAGRVIDQTSSGHKIAMKMTSAPREGQVAMLERAVQSIALGTTGLLLSAKTGTGKTYCGLYLLAHLGVTALVVVPRDALVQQWKDRILEHTNLTEEDIGIAQQDKCDFVGKKIVIGMVHSLAKDKYPREFKEYFGAIVYDEAHVLGAQTFSETVGMFPAKYRIGMSATLRRADGMEDVFKLSIGEKTFDMGVDTAVTPTVIMRPYKTQSPPHPYLDKIKDAKQRRGIIISALSKDFRRTALMAVYIDKFVKSGRRTLVLSDRKEQIKTLRDVLTGRFRMAPRDVGVFVQETKQMERERVLAHCPVILATYGVMSMGIDVPDLRALVYGTPLSDVEQALGRILRMCAGTKDPVVLDIQDMQYQDAQKWASARRRLYTTSAGAKLVFVEDAK